MCSAVPRTAIVIFARATLQQVGMKSSRREADIVRSVYDHYLVAGMSMGAITLLLNEKGVPTRKQISR